MKIGLLQCGHTAPTVVAKHGDYARMIARLLAGPGRAFETWNVVDGDFPSAAQDADAWVLSGSPLGVYEEHSFIPLLEELTRDIAAAGVPLAGICFGHQLVAQALGGQVARHPGGWRLGPQAYQIDGASKPVTLHAWHRDQVLEVPPDAKVIAHEPGCAIAGLSIGAHVLTLQAHPEFGDGVVADLIDARRGSPGYSDAPLTETAARLGTPVDQSWAAQKIGGFLSQAQHEPQGQGNG